MHNKFSDKYLKRKIMFTHAEIQSIIFISMGGIIRAAALKKEKSCSQDKHRVIYEFNISWEHKTVCMLWLHASASTFKKMFSFRWIRDDYVNTRKNNEFKCLDDVYVLEFRISFTMLSPCVISKRCFYIAISKDTLELNFFFIFMRCTLEPHF